MLRWSECVHSLNVGIPQSLIKCNNLVDTNMQCVRWEPLIYVLISISSPWFLYWIIKFVFYVQLCYSSFRTYEWYISIYCDGMLWLWFYLSYTACMKSFIAASCGCSILCNFCNTIHYFFITVKIPTNSIFFPGWYILNNVVCCSLFPKIVTYVHRHNPDRSWSLWAIEDEKLLVNTIAAPPDLYGPFYRNFASEV